MFKVSCRHQIWSIQNSFNLGQGWFRKYRRRLSSVMRPQNVPNRTVRERGVVAGQKWTTCRTFCSRSKLLLPSMKREAALVSWFWRKHDLVHMATLKAITYIDYQKFYVATAWCLFGANIECSNQWIKSGAYFRLRLNPSARSEDRRVFRLGKTRLGRHGNVESN